MSDETPVAGETATLLWDTYLHRDADGPRERELLFGDRVEIIESGPLGAGTMSFVRSAKDGYVGWLDTSALGPATNPTHWVTARTTFVYPAPDLKRAPMFAVHMTSPVRVEATEGDWSRISYAEPAWLPTGHVSPIGQWIDPVTAARAFLGTHYIWAGNSGVGLDCSGLVTAAYRAAGCAMPGDSDLQEAMPGQQLTDADPLQPGDLIFWDGHVAIATGPDTMIHANAHHMMVAEEPIAPAIARIATTETGPVTSRLRPDRRPL